MRDDENEASSSFPVSSGVTLKFRSFSVGMYLFLPLPSQLKMMLTSRWALIRPEIEFESLKETAKITDITHRHAWESEKKRSKI